MGPSSRTRRSRAAKGSSASRRGSRTSAPARKSAARRADFGAPVDGFFARQPAHLRAILEELRALVLEAAPGATGSIKWGMPFFAIGREMMCALGAHRAHVNLVLPGPPGTYADPARRLEGEGKTGKHLAVRALDELPRTEVRRWLRTAAQRARAGKGRR